MNTPSTPDSFANKGPLGRLRKFFLPLLGIATVGNAAPSPVANTDNGGISHMEQTELGVMPQLSPATVTSAVVVTQDKVEAALKPALENPEQKIIDVLNQARKNFNLQRITMSEKDQEVFFDMCHKHYLGESMIVSGNPEANLQPLRRYLYRMGTTFEELQKLFGIKSAKV